MTISISRNYFWEIYFEDEPTKQRYDSLDEFDILWQYPPQFGKGYSRTIELREGLGLLINDYRLDERLVVKVPERAGDDIQYIFRLSGSHEIWDIHTGNLAFYELTRSDRTFASQCLHLLINHAFERFRLKSSIGDPFTVQGTISWEF